MLIIDNQKYIFYFILFGKQVEYKNHKKYIKNYTIQ